MRPWETEFVFVCEKEILKRKSRRFSYLRSRRHLCMRGVRVAHMGIVERHPLVWVSEMTVGWFKG